MPELTINNVTVRLVGMVFRLLSCWRTMYMYVVSKLFEVGESREVRMYKTATKPADTGKAESN